MKKQLDQKQLLQEKLEFLAYLKDIRGLSIKTVQTYEIVLNQALKLIDIKSKAKIPSLNLMPYRKLIAKQNANTINKKIAALNTYFNYLKELRNYDFKLIGNDHIKALAKLPNPLSQDKINEVLKITNSKEHLLILMFYGLGLRLSELANIKLENINYHWLKVLGKGNKERILPLLPNLSERLFAYIASEQPKQLLFKEKDYQIRYILQKLFYKQGIKMHPHQLRHSFATHLLNQGARINDVSELLGHSSLVSTQRYTKISNTLKYQHYLKAHPLETQQTKSKPQ